MKRSSILVALLTLSLSGSRTLLHADQCPGSSSPSSKPRVIDTCILNDAHAPVDTSLIDEILRAIAADFSCSVQIDLDFAQTRQFSGDPTAWPIDLGMEFTRACSRETQIRILFTNRRFPGAEIPPGPDEPLKDSELAGGSHPYFGYAMIFNVEKRYAVRDKAGKPAPITALKHELGHVFNLEHTLDARSFMFTPSSRSQGEWSPDNLEQFAQNRERTWYRKASSP